MNVAHYHAIAGIHGYMPNYNARCDDYSSAVDSLVQLHELGRRRAGDLRRDGYLELNCHRDGNEYCEITDCLEGDCETED